MALPSSGQISMGDINVELGRARTTTNTLLAGGSTPIAASLFGLANSSVNKVAPHSISEFYGYNNAPTNYNLTIYGVNPPGSVGDIRYTINGGARVTLGSLNNTCQLKGTITAANGSTVNIYVTDSGTDNRFRIISGTSSCPAYSLPGSVFVYTITVTSNGTYALASNMAL
jgi:hypothetical protein